MFENRVLLLMMQKRFWKLLLFACISLGCAGCRAEETAPVYVPSTMPDELPTVTVRGFLNFRTTVDGTVIVFTPASETSPTPAVSSSLDYAQERTELENEAHTPEDDRHNFRQRHFKPGFGDLDVTPDSSLEDHHKMGLTPSLPQYPTGLVTVLGGTHVQDGATTVFETKVIGTYIEGKYAQILQSTSQIIFPAKSEELSTPKPNSTKAPSQQGISSKVPMTSSKVTPSKSLEGIFQTSNRFRPAFIKPTPPHRSPERRKDESVNANTVLQSSFKLPESVPHRHSTQALQKPSSRSSYTLSRRFRPSIIDVPPEDENTVPETQHTRRLPPRFRYVLPRRNTPSVRLNPFKVKLTMRNEGGTSETPISILREGNTFDDEPVEPTRVVYEKTTITSEVTLHVGRRKSVRTLTITTSVPKTRHLYASEEVQDIGKANNNLIFATLHTLEEESIPHIVVTRTYTTTERMLKTSIVPILENDTTSYRTVTESFFILKLITGYKTLPAGDMTMLTNSTNDMEFEDTSDHIDGLLDGALQLQASSRQPIMQTVVPNGILQASGSGREQAVIPYDQPRSNALDLSNSLLSLGAALQQNPLAAVYLGLQQLNRQATLYSTLTKTSTYIHTDTVYSTKVVSFYDGRRTRTRTLSESVTTTEKTMTSLTTTVEPYLNTQLFQQNQLQQLLGGTQLGAGPQLLAPPQQFSTITSTYTTVTTATNLSTRIYTLIYNAISTKFRTVTSTSLYETTITATTTSEVPIAITAPPAGVFPFLG